MARNSRLVPSFGRSTKNSVERTAFSGISSGAQILGIRGLSFERSTELGGTVNLLLPISLGFCYWCSSIVERWQTVMGEYPFRMKSGFEPPFHSEARPPIVVSSHSPPKLGRRFASEEFLMAPCLIWRFLAMSCSRDSMRASASLKTPNRFLLGFGGEWFASPRSSPCGRVDHDSSHRHDSIKEMRTELEEEIFPLRSSSKSVIR